MTTNSLNGFAPYSTLVVSEFAYKIMGPEVDPVIDELDSTFGESFAKLSIFTKRALLGMTPTFNYTSNSPKVMQALVNELSDFTLSISPVTNVIGRARGEQILNSLRKSGVRFKVLSFDVAALKLFNEYGIGGPNAGDGQLNLIGHFSEKYLATKDGNFLLIHWGGDEFIIIIFDGELDEVEFADYIKDSIDTASLLDVTSTKVMQAYVDKHNLFDCEGIELLKTRIDYLKLQRAMKVRLITNLTWALFSSKNFVGFAYLWMVVTDQIKDELASGNVRLRESDLAQVYEDEYAKHLAKKFIPQPKVIVFTQLLDSVDMKPDQDVVNFVNDVPLIKKKNASAKRKAWETNPKAALMLDIRLDFLTRRFKD
jgi:GGDEF domain-containing protein